VAPLTPALIRGIPIRWTLPGATNYLPRPRRATLACSASYSEDCGNAPHHVARAASKSPSRCNSQFSSLCEL